MLEVRLNLSIPPIFFISLVLLLLVLFCREDDVEEPFELDETEDGDVADEEAFEEPFTFSVLLLEFSRVDEEKNFLILVFSIDSLLLTPVALLLLLAPEDIVE